MVRKKKQVKQDPKACPVVFMLSDEELGLLNQYVKKHKLRSRSAFIRSLVMTKVAGSLRKSSRTLFDCSNEECSYD